MMHVYVIDIDKDREAATGPQHKDIDLPNPIISEIWMERPPGVHEVLTLDGIYYTIHDISIVYSIDNSQYYVVYVKQRLE